VDHAIRTYIFNFMVITKLFETKPQSSLEHWYSIILAPLKRGDLWARWRKRKPITRRIQPQLLIRTSYAQTSFWLSYLGELLFCCQLDWSIFASIPRRCIISQYAQFLEAVRCPMPCINIRFMNRKSQRVNQSFGKEIRQAKPFYFYRKGLTLNFK